MSKQARRRQHRPSTRGSSSQGGAASFTPVPVRHRHDGWTAARQAAFLQALADCACVEEAARAVGMSARSAYTLKARADARSFRQAWDAALDYAVGQLGDALIGRALHGEATPVFYQGEQIGVKRRFDNRLAMWLLGQRQPERWGRARAGLLATRADPDGAAQLMRTAIAYAADDAAADEADRPRTPRAPLRFEALKGGEEPLAEEAVMAEQQEARDQDERFERYLATLHAQAGDAGAGRRDDAARKS